MIPLCSEGCPGIRRLRLARASRRRGRLPWTRAFAPSPAQEALDVTSPFGAGAPRQTRSKKKEHAPVAVPKRRTSRSKRNMRRAAARQGRRAEHRPLPQLRRARRAAPRMRVVRPLQGPRGQARHDDDRRVKTSSGASAGGRCATLAFEPSCPYAHARPPPLANSRHRALPAARRADERRPRKDGRHVGRVDHASARASGSAASRPTAWSRATWPHGRPASALEMAGLRASDLDMIIVGTVTPDMPMPATAAFVQQKLGAGVVPRLRPERGVRRVRLRPVHRRSVHRVGADAPRAGRRRRAALARRRLDGPRRRACSSATARAPRCSGPATRQPRGPEAARRAVDVHPHRRLARHVAAAFPAAAASHRPRTPRVDQSLQYVHMKGQDIFKVAVKNLLSREQERPRARRHDQERHRLGLPSPGQQAASSTRWWRRVEVPPEKVLMNIDRVGNTSSASIPILLDESLRAGKVRPGDTVLMCALGAGISWGSAIVRI